MNRIYNSAAAILFCVAAMASAQTTDRLEPGLQGQTLPEEAKLNVLSQPYSKGVNLIGHTDLWARGSNLLLDTIDSCAYVSTLRGLPGIGAFGENKAADGTKRGIAIIDASDPRNPRPLRVLQDKGAIDAAETMNAISAPNRKVLVAGAYFGGKPGAKAPDEAAWLDIYDASDCRNPKLVNEYRWPENVHMVTLSPSGKRVYGTSIDPFTGKGGIMILDISDMAHPRFVGKFAATRPDGTSYEFACHEVHLSADERRIYAGVVGSKGEDLNQGAKKGFNADTIGSEAGGIYIFDNSDLVDGKPDPKLRLISEVQHGGWHSVVQAQLGGIPFLVGSGELEACPGAWPRFTNIADEGHPFLAGEFRLAMNRKENCPAQTPQEKATGGIIGSVGTASTHFNDVDTPTNTRMGLFPFQWAGLRIVNIQDPTKPFEVAYFKPGDACMSHVHYMPRSGQVWFACTYSGFYVIELKPEVRAALGLPAISRQRRRGK